MQSDGMLNQWSRFKAILSPILNPAANLGSVLSQWRDQWNKSLRTRSEIPADTFCRLGDPGYAPTYQHNEEWWGICAIPRRPVR